MPLATFDVAMMRRAIELARRGEGHVEPNPLVGAVLLAAGDEGRVVAEAWHAAFGGPHAEAAALAAAGEEARGGTLYVTLEPCCHHGKTPPCTEAIIRAGIARVVVAAEDPFPEVAGGGFAALRQAGITVERGLLAAEARRLTAPFRKLTTTGKPWVIAKWAMSLDGHVAARPGEDRWISSPESRALVHALRGRSLITSGGIGSPSVARIAVHASHASRRRDIDSPSRTSASTRRPPSGSPATARGVRPSNSGSSVSGQTSRNRPQRASRCSCMTASKTDGASPMGAPRCPAHPRQPGCLAASSA